MMRELHREGRTIILITHDNEIAAQADRVIKIKDGYIESDTSWSTTEEYSSEVTNVQAEALNEEGVTKNE
jgi:ABC-type lipoprotein export system ATPase subunit